MVNNKNTALSVPTIDIGSISNSQSGLSCDNRLIEEIRDACAEWGFFYVVNHGVSPTLIDRVTNEGFNFFDKPKEFKDTVSRKEGNFQGYADTELTKRKVDWKQVFDYSAEASLDPNVPRFDIHGVNQWPEGLPEFKAALMEYFEAMQKLSKMLMEVIMQSLTADKTIVARCFATGGDTSFCRLNYYPVCPTPESNLGVGPHSDAGILTVLYQHGSVNSLQVQKDGKFYDVPPIPNSFVINIGDMTQVLSNGRFQAPVHRVLANHTESRFSIPFFLNPSYPFVVKPLDDCVNVNVSAGHPPKYRPILWGDFRSGRVRGDYADYGEEIQISHFEIH